MEKYDAMKKVELVEVLEARGYGRVSVAMSKARLVLILVADDRGEVDQRAW